jgi:hypothetical protein
MTQKAKEQGDTHDGAEHTMTQQKAAGVKGEFVVRREMLHSQHEREFHVLDEYRMRFEAFGSVTINHKLEERCLIPRKTPFSH